MSEQLQPAVLYELDTPLYAITFDNALPDSYFRKNVLRELRQLGAMTSDWACYLHFDVSSETHKFDFGIAPNELADLVSGGSLTIVIPRNEASRNENPFFLVGGTHITPEIVAQLKLNMSQRQQ